ncbi:MAG: sigma-54-dependent Fis family transcriptional regulator [Deltaproteobacteria bacterium]|nr:sigma-54-dependent Fis family transcriptional regulator [Deltaproteobacteria bacterium]
MENSDDRFSLLMVDDEPSVLSSLKRVFLEDDYQIHTAGNGAQALELLSEVKIDAALIDLKMPGMDGLTLLKAMREDFSQTMVIMLTGHGSIQDAVEAVKLGAVDFLEKPYAPEALRTRIAQLHQIWHLREENRQLRARIEFQFGFDRLVGNSTVILKLKELIAQLGPNDAPILIQGETGTGKELVARAIHHHSARSAGNFVPVDCAAISETVIESELFGHVKGAFTGAHMSTLGLVRSADGGTLFLDEVGELSPAIQSKLLRTIQESEVRGYSHPGRHESGFSRGSCGQQFPRGSLLQIKCGCNRGSAPAGTQRRPGAAGQIFSQTLCHRPDTHQGYRQKNLFLSGKP